LPRRAGLGSVFYFTPQSALVLWLNFTCRQFPWGSIPRARPESRLHAEKNMRQAADDLYLTMF